MSAHVSPEFVRTIGWALLHFVWQGGVIALFVSLTLAMCRRASLRYAVAVAGLSLMVAAPVATIAYLNRPAEPLAFSSSASDETSTAKSVMPGIIAERTYHAPQTKSPVQTEVMLWLVRGWMLGVMLFGLRSAGGFVLAQRLRRIATVPAADEVLRLCLRVQQRMGLQRAVKYCRSAALQVPAVFGGLRPIVLLPITALTGLSDAQVEAIVAHELAHIQRLDYFVNLFQVFAETVLFYHPAVWWVNRKIRVERENCCDDTAIAVCGNRLEYVRALTHLESLRMTPQFAMAANGSPLKARVRRLLGMTEEREEVRGGSSLLGVMIVAGVVLAGTSFVNGAKPQEQNAPAVADAPWAQTVDTPAKPDQPVQPETPAKPSAGKPVLPAAPATPHTESDAPAVAESTRGIEVHTPAVNVHVPRVNVVTPAVVVNNQMVHIAMPAKNIHIAAIDVHVPAMNFTVPRINTVAIAAQAMAGSTSASVPSESYIDGMKAAGYGDLSIDELVAMKVQGITPEYAREMKAAGLKIDTDDLVALKVSGVTPQYVKDMRAAYPGIDTDQIVGFKVQGVSPEYVAEFTKLGVKADADEIMGLRTQGVTAQYVREMRATGLNFDTDELIGMKVQGVTPQYVAGLQSAGLGKLDADEIIGAKVTGITPEFVEKAKSHGFKDLTLDKLIELKNANIM